MSKTYSDLLFEGKPASDDYHSIPILPEDYKSDFISSTPKIPLPNGNFLFYLRANTEFINKIKSDARLFQNVIADTWEDLFNSTYQFWGWVFNFEVLVVDEPNNKASESRKLHEINNEKLIAINPPCLYAGDKTPIFEIKQEQIDFFKNISNDQSTSISLEEISKELIEWLVANPERLYSITPRTFELLIADILRNNGWDIEITSQTRDGGFDLYGIHKNVLGIKQNHIIECKRFAAHRKVDVGIVRSLLGVKQSMNVQGGLIVTTSSLTTPAQQLITSRLDLDSKTYLDLKEWLKTTYRK